VTFCARKMRVFQMSKSLGSQRYKLSARALL
jgi:hypothetical protein